MTVFENIANPIESGYRACHVINGLYYAAFGRQVRNPLLRHDPWALYVPKRRFLEVVERSGFCLEKIDIVYSRPHIPSINAWLVKDR